MRMLYSSSKANVSEILVSAGGKIDCRIEVNTPDDISQELIDVTLHPPKEEKAAAFAKPVKPGKGARRLIRDTKKD